MCSAAIWGWPTGAQERLGRGRCSQVPSDSAWQVRSRFQDRNSRSTIHLSIRDMRGVRDAMHNRSGRALPPHAVLNSNLGLASWGSRKARKRLVKPGPIRLNIANAIKVSRSKLSKHNTPVQPRPQRGERCDAQHTSRCTSTTRCVEQLSGAGKLRLKKGSEEAGEARSHLTQHCKCDQDLAIEKL
jgi:hypothetical protein